MRLYELFEETEDIRITDREVTGITDNSQKVTEGCVFVCIRGASFDGHTKAAEAIAKGAVAVVAERDLGLEEQIITADTRECYGRLCAKWFDHPERKMKFIGVTGTNGKTTMTNIIKKILTSHGHKTGLIGTIQNEIGDTVVSTKNTTPLTYEYMELLSRMVNEGCDTVVMEVSSFGLVQHRIGPTRFAVSVFTNLTQDHLDYHKTMEEYYLAKKMLFDISELSVCNIDDEYGRRLFSEIKSEKYSFSRMNEADFSASDAKLGADGTSFKISHNGKTYPVNMLMTGAFNIENVTAAVAAAVLYGVPFSTVSDVISRYPGVKGRCEMIPTGRDFSVICDYAHTPDAVSNILGSVKEYCRGRLICVMGCGGNRDSDKRPKMAKAASGFADLTIVTSDNPRNEEPEMIIEDILRGFEGTDAEYITVTDRREAIYKALALARRDDIIVLVGKGHEDYQELRDNVRVHFDEREVVADGLRIL